jgi:hypothetical protein
MPYIRFVFFFIFAQFFYVSNTSATHLAGGTITYEYVSDSVYDIYLAYYRDCRGVPFSNPSSKTYLNCKSTGKRTTLALTLISIKDITFVCSGTKKPCNPKNTYGAGNGLEEHLYKVRIDFRKSTYQSYYSCGNLIIETGQCCRNSALNTGLANKNYYNYVLFNVNKAPKNSSPAFKSAPKRKLCCNQPAYWDFDATDKDGDSLSYHLSDPLISWNSPAKYSSSFSKDKPLKVYGTTTNPKSTPPSGFYLDPVAGQLIFTPTGCQDYSGMVETVKEWRKNSKGKYELIGTVNREIQMSVQSCGRNNPPTIKSPYSYSVCEGSKIEFTIKTDDKTISPAANDTVTLSWNKGIPNASFKIVSNTALHQSAKFSWTPSVGSGSKLPYTFTVTANDNHCTIPAVKIVAFRIMVKKNIKTTTTAKTISCGSYIVSGSYDSSVVTKPSYQWNLLDTSGNTITDTSIVQFDRGSFTGNGEVDSFTIMKPGIYVISSRAYKTGYCSGYDFDTISSIGVLELIEPEDTFICKDQKFEFGFVDSISSLITSQEWTWNSQSDTNKIFSAKMDLDSSYLFVKAKGTDGCEQIDSVELNAIYQPQLVDLKDSIYCKLTGYPIYTAVDELDSGNVSNIFTWSTGTKGDTAHITKAGLYWASVSNACGSDRDSFIIRFDLKYDIQLGADMQACDVDSVFLGDSLSRSNVKYKWSTGDTSSFIYAMGDGTVWVQVKNGCGSIIDSIQIQFDQTPIPLNWPDTLRYCDTINANYNALNSGATYLWNDGSTSQTKQIVSDGWKWVEVASKHCGIERDSTFVILNYSPRADLGADTIVYCDVVDDVYDAGNVGAKYLWDDGSSNQTKIIDTVGWHFVKVQSKHCGSNQDSVYADLIFSPSVDLGNDTTINTSFNLTLDAGEQDVEYLWSTNDTTQTISVSNLGTYWVEISNVCDTVRDSITISKNSGVFDADRFSQVSIIPNPSTGLFEVFSAGSPIINVLVFDELGRKVNCTSNSSSIFSINDVLPGVYFVQVKLETALIRRKLIVQ